MQYVIHKNYFAKGVGEITYIKNVGEMILLIAIWLNTRGYNVPIWIIGSGALVLVLILWLTGYLWDKNQFYHIECEFGNKRNFFVEEMRKLNKKLGGKK